MQVNYINNYLKPNAESFQRALIVFTAAANEDTQFYVSGNIVEQRDAVDLRISQQVKTGTGKLLIQCKMSAAGPF